MIYNNYNLTGKILTEVIVMEVNLKKSINYGMPANVLKIIAICAMLIDHITWAFVPAASLEGQILHMIGRLTAPIMCYFIAEGYHYTHDVKKYAERLGIFAIISHIPFIYFEAGKIQGIRFNMEGTSVIYTLFLGLMALVIYNSKKLKKYIKIILIILICIASIPGDWCFFAVLWVLFFGINYGNIKKQMISFSIISATEVLLALSFSRIWWEQIFQAGVFLVIPLLLRYNGQLGYDKNNKKNKWIKWSFYIFYPLHLLILGLIKYLIL